LKARFAVYYPRNHHWDARTLATVAEAINHADSKAYCYSVHKCSDGYSYQEAEYLRCVLLDSECSPSCRYIRKYRRPD